MGSASISTGFGKAVVGKGDWVSGTVYNLNNLLTNRGDTFLCILPHTAASTNEPGVGVNTATYWLKYAEGVPPDTAAALAGTQGTPSSANKFVTDGDTRLGAWVTPADDAISLAKIADGTQGSVLICTADGEWAELGFGTDGYVLASQGTGKDPHWIAPPSTTPASDSVTLAMMEHGVRGDVLVYNGSGGPPTRLTAGQDGYVLTAGGATTDLGWEAIPAPITGAITRAMLATGTQGSILIVTSAGAVTDLGFGSDGYILATQGTGKDPHWIAPPSATPATDSVALTQMVHGSEKGGVLVYNGSDFAPTELLHGNAGDVLTSGGNAVDVGWAAPAAPAAHNQNASTIAAGTFPTGSFDFTDTQQVALKTKEIVPTFTAGARLLTAAECANTIVNNYSQAEASTITLPAATSGLALLVIAITTTWALHIKPGSGDKVYLNGVPLDDDDKVSLATPAAGNCAAFFTWKTGASSYDWYCNTIFGTWTDGGA